MIFPIFSKFDVGLLAYIAHLLSNYVKIKAP
jgi:hypothetical protein